MKPTLASLALFLAVAGCAPSADPAPVTTPAPAPSRSVGADARSDSVVQAIQRQIGNGSIIADAQLGRNPPMAVGACVHPVEAARWELERSLAYVPDRPPVRVSALALPTLPESLRDSEVRTGAVLARLVVDTTGLVIPGSTTIVSSPHGLMSARVCAAVLMMRFTPARDDGRLVRARVELPIQFVP